VGHLDRVLTSPLDLETLHSKRLTVFGVSNRLRNAAQRAETVRGFVRDVLPFFEEGRIHPLVDKAYAFDELPTAIAFMESDAQVGKIVVRGGGN
jgi:NADPH:quinone reductase-like Zn-dependent oxidoreductase